MKPFIRVLIVLLALTGCIEWAILVWRFRDPWRGWGDGAPTTDSDPDSKLFAAILLGAVWFIVVSPYLCMAGGALNLLTGRLLGLSSRYSSGTLALITVILALTTRPTMECIALGNVIIAALYFTRRKYSNGQRYWQ
jgi:hypothetical protein